MHLHFALPLAFTLAACGSSTLSSAAGIPVRDAAQRSSWIPPGFYAENGLLRSLTICETVDQMHAELAAGFAEAELQHEAFDQVTLDARIDKVTSAVMEIRRQPEDLLVLGSLSDAVALYVATRRETQVRRVAGAASCLPTVRN